MHSSEGCVWCVCRWCVCTGVTAVCVVVYRWCVCTGLRDVCVVCVGVECVHTCVDMCTCSCRKATGVVAESPALSFCFVLLRQGLSYLLGVKPMMESSLCITGFIFLKHGCWRFKLGSSCLHSKWAYPVSYLPNFLKVSSSLLGTWIKACGSTRLFSSFHCHRPCRLIWTLSSFSVCTI